MYVARYGWNRRSGSLIVGAAVFVLLALTVPMSLALRVVTLVFFGGGALVFIASIATRRVALRVDASGVTLGGSPGRYGATTVLIPWADIREIVLWRQPMPYVMVIHQAPTDGGDHRTFPFHVEFHPPLRKPDMMKFLAGPEIGGGTMTNESNPDEKAADLRAVSAIHYTRAA